MSTCSSGDGYKYKAHDWKTLPSHWGKEKIGSFEEIKIKRNFKSF